MPWSDFQNEPSFARIIKFATITGIFISASGVIWEVWNVLQATQTRSRAVVDAIETGLHKRVLFWLATGILVPWFLIIVGALFLKFKARKLKH